MKKIFYLFLFFYIQSESDIKIKFFTGKELTESQWKTINDLHILSFYQAFKDIPLNDLDISITENQKYDLISYLKNRTLKYRCEASEKDYYIVAMAYKNRKIAGYGFYHFLSKKDIFLDYLVVSNEQKRSGIGKSILNEIIKLNPLIDSIFLSTRISNIIARNFYKKLDFKEIETSLPELNIDKKYSIVLKKELNKKPIPHL